MAEGGEPAAAAAQDLILEDYFMMEEEPLVDKSAEEDEIDLYINLTFTSTAYLEQNEGKTLKTDPEQAPLGEFEEGMVEEKKSEAAETESMLEDVAENESLHPEPPLAYDAMDGEEEIAMAEQEEDSAREEDHTSEEAEEPNDLGDPAVMRAVRGQRILEREDSAVLDSRVANNLSDYPTDYLTASKPGMLNSTLKRVPSLSMMEALDRASMSRVNLDFLVSPVQASYLDTSGLERSGFCGRTLKPSSQRFMRQQSPTMPGSMRSPYQFTPPRRTRRVLGLNQTSGYASSPPFRPSFPNVSSPTWPMAHTLDPPPFSPSTVSPQKFSAPSAMTQLHPLHQRILTQRQRGQERRIPCMEPQPPEVDSYAGLMTPVEKDWVIKVQMLQLQSDNLDRDDYYYQEYYRKLERKHAEKGLLGGCKAEVPKLVTPYIQKVEAYESVVRIPGSLGQVAVSTCYSPRRAIDAVHHIPLEQAVGNQRLQVLYQIEKMYLQLLNMEDIQRKLEQTPEEQHPHFSEKLAHEAGHIYQILRTEEQNAEKEAKDEFLQILLVRKGKRLVARLLPHLSQEQAKQVLVSIVQHLPFLIQKDMLDETLPILYSPLCEVIEQLTFSEMIAILQELTRLQFAISLLYLLLSHGERCLSSGMPLKPHNGDFEKWVDTVLLVARELSQVPKASMVEPLHLPSNLLFLFCRYVDKDTVNRLDVKME
ncbi:protein PAT1 homolog 2 isoform X3 [Rhineura floridana]|uniref:protein PAT1 homolog 2 isoform X3 n=1 Tax=Rhineura floridana TaxID=261503 RepID=UPI002AC83357|nr:protein PAT1 homolog 2 isoform X3 [Rhineura floridana]